MAKLKVKSIWNRKLRRRELREDDKNPDTDDKQSSGETITTTSISNPMEEASAQPEVTASPRTPALSLAPFAALRQPLLVHIAVVLFFIWLASLFHFSTFSIYALAFLYLFEAHRNYIKRIRMRIRSEERRFARQERPLSDFQTVHWLNQVIDKIWIHFLEKFISRDLLGPMIPWFLDKFKPGTVGKVTLQHLSLGRRPPMFTGLRILEKPSEDDHLVMELCLDFLAAEDMHAILNAQMRGLGIWSRMHVSRLQIEGKVRVGLKFTAEPPYLSRIRLCFESAPYVQMTARPIFSHGVDVGDIPGVSGWMDRIVADVFEKSLVEPNMLVVDVEKLVNSITTLRTPRQSSPEDWFNIQEKDPIAFVQLEIIEALDLKASDLNGLSDPFVKVSYSTTELKTKIEKNTLNPKWNENFKVPILSWEVSTSLYLHVYDKDTFLDDKLGYCTINLEKYRGGELYDLWMPLESVKTGRLHITLKIIETVREQEQSPTQDLKWKEIDEKATNISESTLPVEDKYEVVKGDENAPYVSIVNPGQPSVVRNWHQRSQKNMKAGIDSSRSNEDAVGQDGNAKPKSKGHLRINHEPLIIDDAGDSGSSPNQTELISAGKTRDTVDNFAAVNRDEDDKDIHGTESEQLENDQISGSLPSFSSDDVSENTSKRAQVKTVAKGLVKQAGKAARSLHSALSRKGSRRVRNQ